MPSLRDYDRQTFPHSPAGAAFLSEGCESLEIKALYLIHRQKIVAGGKALTRSNIFEATPFLPLAPAKASPLNGMLADNAAIGSRTVKT